MYFLRVPCRLPNNGHRVFPIKSDPRFSHPANDPLYPRAIVDVPASTTFQYQHLLPITVVLSVVAPFLPVRKPLNQDNVALSLISPSYTCRQIYIELPTGTLFSPATLGIIDTPDLGALSPRSAFGTGATGALPPVITHCPPGPKTQPASPLWNIQLIQQERAVWVSSGKRPSIAAAREE